MAAPASQALAVPCVGDLKTDLDLNVYPYVYQYEIRMSVPPES